MNKNKKLGWKALLILFAAATLLLSACGPAATASVPVATVVPVIAASTATPIPPFPNPLGLNPTSYDQSLQRWYFRGLSSAVFVGAEGFSFTAAELSADSLAAAEFAAGLSACIASGLCEVIIAATALVGAGVIAYCIIKRYQQQQVLAMPNLVPQDETLTLTELTTLSIQTPKSWGPEDLKQGLPPEWVNITLGTLTWYSWCQSNHPNGPTWHLGWRSSQSTKGIELKVTSCESGKFPPIDKAGFLALIKSFQDRLAEMVAQTIITTEEAAAITIEIAESVSLFDKYLVLK